MKINIDGINKQKLVSTQNDICEIFSDKNIEHYIWFGREFIYDFRDCHICCNYGTMYPVSIFAVIIDGEVLLIEFEGIDRKNLSLCVKNLRFIFTLKYIDHQDNFINIRRLKMDSWQELIEGYRKKHVKKNSVLSNVFTLKRYFLHNKFSQFTYKRDNLFNCVRKESELVGIDAVMLYDLMYDTENDIRCAATYLPTKEEVNKLNNELIKLKELGIKSFGYFDPYLIEEGSYSEEKRDSLAIRNEQNEILRVWGKEYWHPCLCSQKYLSDSLTRMRVQRNYCFDGMYLDEIGYGEQYQCSSKEHDHEYGGNHLVREKNYVTEVKDSEFSKEPLICEFSACESYMDQFAGFLSDATSNIEILRFLRPDKKYFKIINCDRPIKDEIEEVKKQFFNGLGLWLDNDLNNKEWYGELIPLISKHYTIQKKYMEYFTSKKVWPMVFRNKNNVLINQFSSKQGDLYTYYNPFNVEKVVEIEREVKQFKDIYGGIEEYWNEKNVLKFKVEPHGVGAIII